MTPKEKRQYCFMFMFMFTMCFSTLLICHYLAHLSISLQSVSTINLTREINGLNQYSRRDHQIIKRRLRNAGNTFITACLCTNIT